jgi:superfamily II DNA or RNA helicase
MVSEGFDLAKLDTLVLATPKGDVEQSVGRIQRKQSVEDSDNVPLIIDVVDDYSMFKTQAEKRRRFYTKRTYTLQQN